MVKYTLSYFPIGGRAFLSRLMFHHAGVEFTDNMMTFADWGGVKENTSKFPLKQMPTLEVDGEVICQSRAINRFVANELGLYGSNGMERAIIDQVLETIADMFQLINTVMYSKEAKEKKLEQFKEITSKDKVKLMYNFLTNLLKKKNDGKSFFLGDKLSFADISFYVSHCFFSEIDPQVLDQYEELKALFSRVGAQENIKKYMEKGLKLMP